VIAGGLGLAPLRPAILHLLENRTRYGSINIFYGARTPADILFRHQLEQWRGQFDLKVDVTVDRAAKDWRGKVGVVTKLINRGRFDPKHSIAMVCGPEVMMRFTIMTLNELGIKDPNIFLSMERNMQCGTGLCGHCQLGPKFVCKDGPVFRFSDVKSYFETREL